ncbi:MAG: F0F1 ATP synthase subunit A [Acidobacteria bacterium]|jgi:F-type H+-transporting ATPase subunit a|nr:F0F1 ATP synthase subunit A [Acidobacteriota bacterium]
MHHEYSILFEPVNRLLLAIFGQPSERYLELMGAQHGQVFWLPDHVIMAMLAVVVIAALLIPVKRKLSVEHPSHLQQSLELVVHGLQSLLDDVIGEGLGKTFLPFVGALAIFIFVCNIFGLFFFLQPATANPSTTFALSITAFLFYNVVGVRKQGLFHYLRHFAGPVVLLAPLMVPIELISHLARVLSLALRLFGNIFGEHTATGIFFTLFPFVVPWPMMGLGIFGSLLQAFIFIMLTMAYIQGAVVVEQH